MMEDASKQIIPISTTNAITTAQLHQQQHQQSIVNVTRRRKSSPYCIPIGELSLSLFFQDQHMHVVVGRVNLLLDDPQNPRNDIRQLRITSLCSKSSPITLLHTLPSKESIHISCLPFSQLPEVVLKIELTSLAADASEPVILAETHICSLDFKKDEWIKKFFWLFTPLKHDTTGLTTAQKLLIEDHLPKLRRTTCPPAINTAAVTPVTQSLAYSPTKSRQYTYTCSRENSQEEAQSPDPFLASFVFLQTDPFTRGDENKPVDEEEENVTRSSMTTTEISSREADANGLVAMMRRAFSSPQSNNTTLQSSSTTDAASSTARQPMPVIPLQVSSELRPRCFGLDAIKIAEECATPRSLTPSPLLPKFVDSQHQDNNMTTSSRSAVTSPRIPVHTPASSSRPPLTHQSLSLATTSRQKSPCFSTRDFGCSHTTV